LSKKPCPAVTTKPDFQIERYLGRWYDIKSIPFVASDGNECSGAEYGLLGEREISVFNSGMKITDGTIVNITGVGRQERPDELAYLTIQFPGRPSGQYRILETDYENFSTVYSCESAGVFTFEYAWVLSRQKTLSPTFVQLALSIFTNFGIDVNNLVDTIQNGNCTYIH